MPGAGRKPTVSDAEILHQFVVSPDPVLHPTEISDSLDMSRQGIFKRLQQLEGEQFLSSKKVAGTRIWWITPDGREKVAEAESEA